MPGKRRLDLKKQAIALRVEERLGRNEITERLDGQVAQTTVGRWLRDYPLDNREIAQKVKSRRAIKNDGNKKRSKGKSKRQGVDCLNCGKVCNLHAIKYCSIKCAGEYRHKPYINRWLLGLETGAKPWNEEDISGKVRRFILEEANHSCSECGWNKTNPTSGLVPVQIDHIDGDPKNHRRENLRVLCPSCHSLTPNYMALNMGKGRQNRRPAPKTKQGT